LAVWRKPGAIEGHAACATCHSPDGIELAAYNFDDADIKRRALAHISGEDADTVVAYIHALRAKYGFTRLRDPFKDRPLQPGGEVLPGDTPAQRDTAFGRELRSKLPLLFNGRIETVAQASAAERQLLNLNPVSLRIGIPLNRLSEDVAHGKEHSSIAQWLPETPPAVPDQDTQTWYAACDRYLANPTDETLHDLLTLHERLVNTNRMLGLDELSVFQYRALLVLQDRMRRGTEAKPQEVTPDVLAYGHFNPIWEVGEVARNYMTQGPQAVGMSSKVESEKLAGPSLSDQMSRLRASWFWCGWLSDQGLFRTSEDDKTRLGMWFSQSLSQDGPYPFHDVYANARRQAVVSNNPDSWGESPERKRRIWDFAGLRSFAAYQRDMPTDSEARKLFVTLTCNCFRMSLLLYQAELKRTHAVWVRRNSEGSIRQLAAFIEAQDPADKPSAEKLQADLDQLCDSADERR